MKALSKNRRKLWLNLKKVSSFNFTSLFDLASEWRCHRLSTGRADANLARLSDTFREAGCQSEKLRLRIFCPRRGERDEIVFRSVGCRFTRFFSLI